MKTIVITGTSSGIGKATAKYFASKGWKVAATMRQVENETELKQIENISLYALDVTSEASISKAVMQILNDFEKVDVVVNNAGYDLMGAFEAANPQQIQKQFDVNVFGLMNVTRAFLPHFRAKQSGLFINISSLSGVLTFPFNSLYHASKWAVEGFTESLAFELEGLGIQVKLIEPGAVNTEFYGRSLELTQKEGLTAYDEQLKKYNENKAAADAGSMSAMELAELVFKAVTDGKKQLRYLVGAKAEQLVGLRKAKGDEAYFGVIKQFLS